MNVVFREAASKPLPSLTAPRTGMVVSVYSSLDDAEPLWRHLAAQDCIASPYQSIAWIRLWHRYVSGPRGQEPIIVVGCDLSGAPLFVWPLVSERKGPLTLACFFGGKHATLNMALWRRDVADSFTDEEMRDATAQIRALRPDLDLLALHSQPAAWNGVRNPFMALPHQRASEDNFVLHIGVSGPEIIEREISGTMRSRLRNKERKLARLNGYRYLRATTVADVSRQLAAFFAQKQAKLHSLGIENVFGQPGVEDFIRAACLDGLDRGQPVIELHALECDGEMLALFSGIHDAERFTSMFNSHTATGNARYSPGLILLQHLIVECAERGFKSFDIGPGEARYKSFFCKDLEPIYDHVLPVSARGCLIAPAMRAALWAKGRVKRNPRLWRIAHAMRASLRKDNPAKDGD
jgi:CelD/BcsL family acetyltransferase involved in cellulose biosynthesis